MPALNEITTTSTVHEILRRYPATAGAFDAFGIHTCCGGPVSLEEAARRDGADLDRLLAALRRAIADAA